MIPKAIPMEVRHIVFLLVVFILYVIFGGLIFMLLESPEEQIKRQDINDIIRNFTEHIKQLNDSRINEQYIRTMIHKLLVAQDNNLIDTHGNQSQFINWSFINSFFFAITVTTTIGYGHLTPSTFFGKIFCIFYALFGIPITGLLIGSLADRFSKLYSPKKQNTRQADYQRQLSGRYLMLKKGLISLVPWFFVFLIVPAIIFTAIEQWSFLDGFYYCFVTLSTIGFGDFVAGSAELTPEYVWVYKILVVAWIIFGLAYLSMVLNFIMQSLRSRHISNVMHSLRHRISVVNPNLGGIRNTADGNRDWRHHPRHYKRQQSTPVVLYAQNGKKIFPVEKENLNNNSNNINNNCNNENKFLNTTGSGIQGTTPNLQAKPTGKRKDIFNICKYFKTKNTTRSIEKQPSQLSPCNASGHFRSSLRQAFEDNVSMQQTNSLPDLKSSSDGELCTPSCVECLQVEQSDLECGKITVV